MHINFVMAHMYHVKYFMPLIIAARKRNIEPRVFTFYRKAEWEKGLKSYAHPYRSMDYLKDLAKQYDFEYKLCDNDKDIEGLTFFGEKRGLSNVSPRKDIHKVVLTCLRDFADDPYPNNWYDNYIGKVDNVVLVSEFFAKHYGKISPKNLYLGASKYDVELDAAQIKKDLKINGEKIALVVPPELVYVKQINLNKVYDMLHSMGYSIITKARMKDSLPQNVRGEKYFEDFSWFPHDTMQLIKVANVVVTFDSGVSKECVMLDTPFVNLHVYDYTPFSFFFKYDFCRNLPLHINPKELCDIIGSLDSMDWSEEFVKAREEFLFESGHVSENILDALL